MNETTDLVENEDYNLNVKDVVVIATAVMVAGALIAQGVKVAIGFVQLKRAARTLKDELGAEEI